MKTNKERWRYVVCVDLPRENDARLCGHPIGPMRQTRLQAKKLLRRARHLHPTAYIESRRSYGR